MSDSGKYYTMTQRKADTPWISYTAWKLRPTVWIFATRNRHREQHVKRFTHRLADSQLKMIQKQEDDWDDDRQSGSSTKARDFRVDNLRQGRLRTKYQARTYVTQSGAESDSGERHVMFEDETLEISPAQENVEPREAPPESQGSCISMEELTQHVLKVMENSGWNKPGHIAHQGKASQSNGHPGSPSPRYYNPDRDMCCDNFNEKGHRPENCWADLICETCHRTGHPTQLCKTLLCKKCGKFHDSRCEDW
ncbi:LOW QUALITY PROTEIN: hypothetical protein PHMEG_00013013 [Phytophthora megakarya]|uniref:Eukaryotic/viral aspartic protease n=1 Tax=Phytophthora megakarya TaxID=4795 RepID=A0A225W8Z1_9STRA|nr:LOW QUALITY PROTEIN: hypothetical protein PHMEG_00013013 [Phytophthora megakarya]